MSLSSPSNLRLVAIALTGLATVNAFTDLSGPWAVASDLLCLACGVILIIGLTQAHKVLQKAFRFCHDFSEGDFEARITGVSHLGVFGELCVKMNRVADLTDAFVREVQHSMEHVSEGLYYRKVLERGLPDGFRLSAHALNKVTLATEKRIVRYLDCTDDFEKKVEGVIHKLADESQNLKRVSIGMTDTSALTSQKSDGSAEAASTATQNVQNVASAAEELSASIAEISRQVDISTAQTSAASQQAIETDKLVRSLSEAAAKVGDVVKLINDIASQTNLLALNATIEAARAGEAGKGFAVVAGEVKNLAGQTAKATEEIVLQINTMESAMERAVHAVQDITSKIGTVNDISATIASAVSEQKAATEEIARNIQEAATSTTQVTTDISGVKEAAVETKKTATNVLEVAQDFAEEAAFLQNEVNDFLKVIREK